MKTIIRIAIILIASLIVVGATYALGQNSTTIQEFPSRFEQDNGNSANSEASAETRVRTRPERGESESEGFSIRGVLGFAQTLIPMTIVIALVTLFGKFSKSRSRTQKISVGAG